MIYKPWTFFHTAVLFVVLIVFIILACTVGAEELSGPLEIGAGTLPIDHNMSVIADSDQSADAQLAHENTLAMIETAMKLGEVCVLKSVAENAQRSKKPISLKELSHKADVCVKDNMKSIENRK